MAIDIQNDLPEFTVTDTLHQLVDRLNDLTTALSSNNTLFDSAVNDLLFMVSRDSGQYTADSDLTILSQHDLTLQGGKVRAEAGTVQLVSTGTTEITSTNAILLASDQNNGNVLLRSGGSSFGSLRNTNNNLELTTGAAAAIAVTFTTDNATFPGTVTVPSDTLVTADKTLQGAINEIHSAVISGASSVINRLDTAEGDITALETLTNGHTSTLSNHETRLATNEALNISNRLNTIEAKITSIETRLGILGV